MDAAKEKILNISATAKSGMDKTKATAAEKVEKLKTSDPLQKELAEKRKEEKIHQAELEKQQAYKSNAIRTGETHHTGVEHDQEVGHQTGLATGLTGHHTGVGHESQVVGHQTGFSGGETHHTGVEHDQEVGHQTGLATGLTGHHSGVGHESQEVGHQTGFGGHHTGVEQQTGLDEQAGLYRTDGPTVGADTKVTGQGTGGGLY